MEKTFNLETELTINSVSTTLKAMLWPLVTNTEIFPLRKITTWLDSFKLNIFLEKRRGSTFKGLPTERCFLNPHFQVFFAKKLFFFE